MKPGLIIAGVCFLASAITMVQAKPVVEMQVVGPVMDSGTSVCRSSEGEYFLAGYKSKLRGTDLESGFQYFSP